MYRQGLVEALPKLLAAMWWFKSESERRCTRSSSSSTNHIVPSSGARSVHRPDLTLPHRESGGLTAQSYVLVLIPFQSLIYLLTAVVGPHLVQHIEVRID
jgi:hypothetical protein